MEVPKLEMNNLEDIALSLILLCVIVFVVMLITAVILRFIPVYQVIKNYILGGSAILATILWYKITFM